jgi:hypothetical protein
MKTLFDERYVDNFSDDIYYVDEDDQLIMILPGSGRHAVYYTCNGQKAIDDWIHRGIVKHEDAV